MERWTSAFHLTLFINNTDSGSDRSPWITCVLPEPSSIIWNKMKWWTSWPVSGNLVHDVPLLTGRQLRPTDIYDAFFVNETDLHLNPSNVSQCQWNHYITVAPVASHRSPFYPVTLSGEQFALLRRHTTSIHDHIQCYHREATHFCSAVKRCYRRVSAVILWMHFIRKRCLSDNKRRESEGDKRRLQCSLAHL